MKRVALLVMIIALTFALGWQVQQPGAQGQQGGQQGQGGGQRRQGGQGGGRGGQGGQGGQNGRNGQNGGGPVGVFRTDVPAAALTVIAGAPTDTTIRLSLLSKETAKYTLGYRLDGDAKAPETKQEIELTGGTSREIDLKTLKASTHYTYSLRASGDDSKDLLTGGFMTARKPGSTFVFDIQADSHLDGNTDPLVYENTLKNMVADKPDFLVDLGDTFMVDKYQNYLDSQKQYDAQRYWFSLVGSQMSVFLCLGNHDGETGWRQRGGDNIADWARGQRQRCFPTVRPNTFYTGAPPKGLYYAWNWGDALCVVLDPFVATTQKTRTDEDGWNWTLGREQFDWLEKTLRTSKSKYKFLFIHHLVGGFGKEARGGVEASNRWEWGNVKEFPTNRSGWAEPIHSLMTKYHVTALFHGHDHLYVRQERDGILYLEVPQPSQARGDNTNSAEEYGYKTGKLLGSSGHIRVTVDPKSVKLEYVKSRLAGNNREVVDRAILPLVLVK